MFYNYSAKNFNVLVRKVYSIFLKKLPKKIFIRNFIPDIGKISWHWPHITAKILHL